MATKEDTIYVSCMTMVNGFAMLINFFVVVMFLSFHKKLLSANSNKFLFSMAVADFFVGIFGVIGSILIYLHRCGLVGLEIAKLCGLLPLFGSFFMSILSLSILTVDRLISVQCALRYHSKMTDTRANLLICLTWITVAVLLLIQGGIYLGVSWEMELTVRTYELTVFFVVGAFVLCIGNSKLHFVIRGKRRRISVVYEALDFNSPRHEKRASLSTAKNTLKLSDSKICIWMTTIFIVCWLPTIIQYVAFMDFGKLDRPMPITYTICLSFATSNSLLNPVVYLIKRKDFRKLFCDLFINCRKSVDLKPDNIRQNPENRRNSYFPMNNA